MADTPFAPQVQAIHVSVRRTVRVAAYESFELTSDLTAVPDPNFKVSENLERLHGLVTSKVNQTCDAVERRPVNTTPQEER